MLIPTGYAQVNHKFGGQGAPNGAEVTYGVFHSNFTGNVTDAAGTLHSEFVTRILPNLNSLVQIESTVVKFGPNATGPSAEWAVPVSGSDVTDCMPPQVSYLVRKSTAFGGRAGRGRWFLPGVSEDKVLAGGEVSTATIEALNADLDGWLTAIASAELFAVLLHAGPLAEPEPHIINAMTAQAIVATQRRRVRP